MSLRQFGTWPSPLSAKSLAGSLRLDDVQWDTESDTLVWLEGRGGTDVLVMQQGVDAPRDLTSEMSVRGRVGYGGGSFTVAGGQVYFAGPESRLYRQSLKGGAARSVTPAFGSAAAPRVSPDGRWLAFVHHYEGHDGLALVDTKGHQWPVKLAFGSDFVMQPAWHPDSSKLAYIAWNHPQMPWDGSELHLVTLKTDGDSVPGVAADDVIAGDATTSIFQPEFSPDGRFLAYVSDATGWGQLYLYDLAQQTHQQLTTDEAEHGTPAWIQGMRTYGWSHDSLWYLRNVGGITSLWRCDPVSGKSVPVDALDEYTDLSQIAVQNERIAVIGSAAKIPPRIVTYTAESMPVPERLSWEGEGMSVLVDAPPEGLRVHRRSSTENLLPNQLADAQAITWTGHDGEDVHGLYYAPTSETYTGTGQPPLIVLVHGGPSSQVKASYDSRAQFFATRGFAVLNTNYRGSTGYGKAYMNRLRGNWGIYDVEDSASGALYLVDQGLADRSRLVIMGGSAGGFTVYQSLIDKPGLYRAAVCMYGVANQFGLAMESHKFEERYLDSLLGPLPEAADVYRARSPLFQAEKLVDPIAIFQGEDDPVVPKNQSDSIVASLRARGIPHEYHVYPGEGHGWRKPETIEAFYNSVLKFLQQYVLFA